MNRSKLSNKSVLGVCSFISNGGTIHDSEKEFSISVATVENIIRGIKHSEITGISTEENCHGVDYLRNNKDMFTEKFNNEPTPEVVSEVKETAKKKPQKKTAKAPRAKAKQVSMIIGNINLSAMRDDTTKSISDINSRLDTIDAERKLLEEQKVILLNLQTALTV